MTPQALMEEQPGVAAAGGRRPAPPAARRRALNILLIDEAPEDLVFLRRSLASMPGLRSGVAFDVVSAADPGEVARQIERTRFHLVFLDEQLSRTDPSTTLARVRGLGYSGPVIVLTSDQPGSLRPELIAAGADDYVSKRTVDPGQLRRVILHVIRRRLDEAGAQPNENASRHPPPAAKRSVNGAAAAAVEEERAMAAGTIGEAFAVPAASVAAEAAAAIPRLPEPEAGPVPDTPRAGAGAAPATGAPPAADTHSALMIEIRDLLAGMPPFVDERALSGQAIEALVNRRRIMLQRLETLAEENGRVLFNGEWVTPDEARRNYRRMKWRFRGYVLEVLMLYTVMAAGALGLGAVMLWFTGLAR